MTKSKKSKIYNILFLVVIMLLLIPQTRKPIQVMINKGLATIVKPSVVDEDERQSLSNYNWKLKDISGQGFDFQSVKGKVVIINFWATWCPPCIAEMPSLESLFEIYKTNNEVVFLFVSNEDKEVLDEFMLRHDYTFSVHQPLTEYPEVFNVTSIPRTFIINKEGVIIIDKSGPANWTSDNVLNTIEELLKAF